MSDSTWTISRVASETELREAFRREFRALISIYGKPTKLPEFSVKAGVLL